MTATKIQPVAYAVINDSIGYWTACRKEYDADAIAAQHEEAGYGRAKVSPLYAGAAPAAVAGPAMDVTLDEDQAGLLRDMLGDREAYPEAITVRLMVGDGHSGHGLYVAQAEYQDEGAVLLASLPAPAAPALEAPAAPAVPLNATPEMRAAFRRAYREGGFWADRIDYALDQMLAAAPQAPAAPDDVLCYIRPGATLPERNGFEVCRATDAGAMAVMGDGRAVVRAEPASKRIGQIVNPASEQSQDMGTVVVAEVMSNGYNGQVLWKGKVPPVGTLLYAAPQAAPAAPAVDAQGERDAAFEAVRNRLCSLQRYSFVLDDDGIVRRAHDRTGSWIEFDDAHALFDPVAVDAAIAAQAKEGGAPVADAAPLDVCTDPYNCARCKTHPAHRGDMHHAGISRIGGSA